MSSTQSPRIFYGWIIVAVTALVLIITAGVRSAPGVFIVPVEQEMGWSRGEIAFAVSIGLLLLGASGPASGWLISRFGLKKIMVVGLLLTAISTLALYQVTQLWQLVLLWGVFSGIGTGIIGSVMGPTVANRWFIERRGLVVGIFGASTSAGLLIFTKTLLGLEESMGWRSSSVVLAVIAALCLIPVLLLMRDNPADVGALPYGAKSQPASGPAVTDGSVMRSALRAPEFWLLAITFFVCGATSNGLIGTHFIAHATDHGISKSVSGNTMALMGMMNFIGTLVSGWLTDRYDPRKLLCCYYGFRGLSLLLLPYVHSTFGLSVFAVMFGLDYIATVPPTTTLVADNFGRKNVALIYGWVFCAHQIGAALAGWLGGMARDTLGDYALAFIVAGVIAVVAAMLALLINRGPRPAVVAAGA